MPLPRRGAKKGVRVALRGFTLVELVVVIVVAGVLMATALPFWRGETGFEERGFRDETAAALRYAQKAAVAARRQVCVNFTANGLTARIHQTFGVTDCADGNTTPLCAPLAHGSGPMSSGGCPAGDPCNINGSSLCQLRVSPPDSVVLSYSAANSTNMTFPGALTFSPLGRPGRGVTIAVSGLINMPVIVEAETGYVH